jgi:ribose transport system permease protein
MSGEAIRLRALRDFEPRDQVLVLLLAAMLVIFFGKSLESSLIGNVKALAMIMAPIGIVAAGQTLVIITGGVDLSVGSVVALTSVITAYLAAIGLGPLGTFNPWIAAVIALGIATGVGWLHGTLVSRYGLAPFVVTFGSLSLLRGLAQVISNGSPINLRGSTFDWMWANALGFIPVPALIMLIIFIVTAYLLRNSRYGRYAYAIGSNENVARLSGVNVARTRQIIYASSGLLTGIAGLMLLALIKGGSFNNGQDYELTSIAAVIIGGTSLKGGSGGVWGTLGGILLMSLVQQGLVLFSAPPLWNQVLTGAIILSAALIDIQRRRLQEAAALPPVPPAPLPPPNTLSQATSRLHQIVNERIGPTTLRLYLLDRETDALVSQDAATASALALETRKDGKPVYSNDLRKENPFGITEPDVRAAAAFPLLCQNRFIGVVELQSAKPGIFNPFNLEAAMQAASTLAGHIEDYWLLESGWLARQVREALRRLNDEAELEHCPLAEWLLPTHPHRSVILRSVILDGINHLRAEKIDPASRTARRYQILRQTYIDQRNTDNIIRDLGLSRRQYFYDLKEAVDGVTHYLFSQRRR